MPEIDEIVRKGQEQLRVLMGGRGGGSTGRGPGGGGLPGGGINRTTLGIGTLVLAALWLFASLYRTRGLAASMGAHIAWTVSKGTVVFRLLWRLYQWCRDKLETGVSSLIQSSPGGGGLDYSHWKRLLAGTMVKLLA